jgi:methylglutamate dehydrogenase subunit B
MRIPCPYCGERSNDEFVTIGDADAMMTRPATADLAAFNDYLHVRKNPAGPYNELWYHHAGCRQWLIVSRDTRTHQVNGAVLARNAAGGSQ